METQPNIIQKKKRSTTMVLLWIAIALLGGFSLSIIALQRDEHINAIWFVVASLATYAVAYRFYSRFISNKIFGLNKKRATPAQLYNDGKDYVPTNKWVLYGHHFAAIAGAGPLVGPTLAAQMGYLPGTIWIIAGAVLAGCVQDFVVLIISMRRKGKSIGEIAREEIGPVGGYLALVGVFAIMVILIAVLGIVVVNALKASPWAMFTIAMTIPIALFMGVYMRFLRPGKIGEASIIGFVLLVLALVSGQWVADSATLAPLFTFEGKTIAYMMIGYGFLASVLPVWLLLAPRDYLSTFLKVGVIALLAIGIMIVLPEIKMPAISRFVDGTGPVFSGNLFPFLFITIACGAVSGFHSLISSGTSPKLIANEKHANMIGYGGMLTESFVAIMALVAATLLSPGVYFAINAPSAAIGTDVATAATTISSWGFSVSADEINNIASQVDESSILSRTGGAPSLAVGMAQIFSKIIGGPQLMAFWYHFAILFEAVFILTTIDAGTRVGRFMLQDLLGNIWKPIGRINWMPAVYATSALVVAGWGYFLVVGVTDPLGGINTLWPLFGITNQMLAAIALIVATTVIIKSNRAKYCWVTMAPLAWLLIVTMTAGWQKIFSPLPKIGFLKQAEVTQAALDAGKLPAAIPNADAAKQIIFNNQLDAVLTGIFMLLILGVLLDAMRIWYKVLIKKEQLPTSEESFKESTISEVS
ncbi:carbon starvation protein CstA [Fictibacillus macauensis ZFHKF-1]|uniref:Carbon starvation protein CstA n=1 Tax=Fictibacillus macauensis ZFHKF-1 TaxID=1196324 RepID=I8AG83_9BACL|nr:carbon starvation CstA family protein [Fictibacillus macauensis]EIT84677.1 carbon starvation protein CstA [Fictibacillus macauensis ZFHKF-1]